MNINKFCLAKYKANALFHHKLRKSLFIQLQLQNNNIASKKIFV